MKEINKNGMLIKIVQKPKECPYIEGINQPNKKGKPNPITRPNSRSFPRSKDLLIIFNLVQKFVSIFRLSLL